MAGLQSNDVLYAGEHAYGQEVRTESSCASYPIDVPVNPDRTWC